MHADDLATVIATIAFIGIGATAVMDVWLLLLKCAGIPTQSFALLGRWVGHLLRGRLSHASIASARPIAGELALGWAAHYAVGIAFAGLLLAVHGRAWALAPTLWPALSLGAATVAAPWLVMQPAMGAGIAAGKTARPLANRIRSLANHGVFGAGLYLSAAALRAVAT